MKRLLARFLTRMASRLIGKDVSVVINFEINFNSMNEKGVGIFLSSVVDENKLGIASNDRYGSIYCPAGSQLRVSSTLNLV